MTKAIIICIDLALIFSFSLDTSYAQARQAKIIYQKGLVQVFILKNQKWSNYNPKVSLREGDKVRTGRNSRAEIRFDDGSRIRMQSNTSIILKQYHSTKSGRNANIRLNKGSLYSNVKKLKRKSTFRVSTVTATIGVRGTIFYVSVDKRKTVKVEVYQGTVIVEAQNKKVILKKKQGAIIKSGRKPKVIGINKIRKIRWIK